MRIQELDLKPFTNQNKNETKGTVPKILTHKQMLQ